MKYGEPIKSPARWLHLRLQRAKNVTIEVCIFLFCYRDGFYSHKLQSLLTDSLMAKKNCFLNK